MVVRRAVLILTSLVKHYDALIESFAKKAKEFANILKMGRTQLEDAVPMTLGQTFGAFAQILREEKKNLEFAAEEFLTVNMGATAIGTGICSEPEYSEKCIRCCSNKILSELDIPACDLAQCSDTLLRVLRLRADTCTDSCSTHIYC